MDKITVDCAAKINIGLDITDKRTDGYHDIITLMHSVSIFDTLECEKSQNTKIECTNPSLSCDKSNIIYKCIETMRRAYKITASMSVKLHKRIPIGSGLGGGSADGAGAMLAFSKLYNIKINPCELAVLSSKVGADIPFMFYGGLCICRGIGDEVTKIAKNADYRALIIKPDICVSSAAAYAEIDEHGRVLNNTDFDAVLKGLNTNTLNSASGRVFNSFEYIAEKKHPLIADIKKDLLEAGAEFAQMSGSGSAVYGLFAAEDDVRKAFDKLGGVYPDIYSARLCDKALYIK